MKLSRPRPTKDHPVLSIPDSLWDQMLDALATTAPGLERVAYLDGIRWTDRAGRRHGTVTTITLPDAELSAGHYRVSGDAVTRASEHLFAHGLIRLAQVHTHGDQCTDHSPVDDARAYSQRDGALSLVLPYHAVRRPRPDQAREKLRPLSRPLHAPWQSQPPARPAACCVFPCKETDSATSRCRVRTSRWQMFP